MRSTRVLVGVAAILLILILVPCVHAEEYRYITRWGCFDYLYPASLRMCPDNGELDLPWGVAVDDANSWVYVADHNNGRIQKFDLDGNYISQWDMIGVWGIAVDSEGFVYSTGNGIVKNDSSGNPGWRIPGVVAEGIGVDNDGNIYVAEVYANRTSKYDKDANLVTQWGSPGTGPKQFNAPTGLAVDKAGYVFVVDRNNNRIQKFSFSGDYLGQWGGQGSGDGQFNYPEGVAVDGDGNIYVTDIHNYRVQKFAPDKTFITKFGTDGTNDPGPGEFWDATGIAVDMDGNNVYVADYFGNRVQKFSKEILPGTVISQHATVFIGEEGLDITPAIGGETQIAWFPSAAPPGSTPERTIDVSGTNFFVNPADFETRTGTWYQWPSEDGTLESAVPAFIVADPGLAIKTIDLDTFDDVSGKSVLRGALLGFDIETNMYPAVNQDLRSPIDYATDGYIDIKVTDHLGTTYTALWSDDMDPDGSPYPIVDNFVDQQPWTWGSVDYGWQTGALDGSSPIYSAGTYTISAESTLHHMKDNYKDGEGGDYTGKTVSYTHTVTILDAPTIDPPEVIMGDHRFTDIDGDGHGDAPPQTSIKVSDPLPEGSRIPLFPGLGEVEVPTTVKCGDGSEYVYAVVINSDTEANYAFPVYLDFVCENGAYIGGEEQQKSEPLIPLSLVEGTVPNVAGLTPCEVDINPFKTFAGASATSCTANTENNYALLISGGLDKDHNPARYYNDIKFMYNTLVTDYGYDPANITVLMSDGPDINLNPDKIDYYDQYKKPVYGNSDPNLNGDLLGNSEVNGPATKDRVNQALEELNNKLGPSDTLFVFTTGHGAMLNDVSNADPTTNDVALYLWDDGSTSDPALLYYTDEEFVEKLPKNAGAILMTMEQCNGGGFINDFITGGAQTRVISTAANGNEVSHSNDFSYPWISAVAGHDAATPPSLTDADISPVDTQVSMNEAFTYARDRDASARARVETPQSVSSIAGADTSQFLSPPCSPIYSIFITSPDPINTPTWSGTKTITWTYSGPQTDTVRIELWKDTQWGALKQLDISKSWPMTTAEQSYSWRIPTSLPLGAGQYYIKISTNSPAPPVSGQSVVTISPATTQRTGTMTIKSTPLTDASIWINDVMSGTTADTTPKSMPPLTYPVKVALSGYYPIGPTNVKVNQGLPVTKSFPLVAVEQTDNALLGFRHIVIDSVPDGASIFINGVDNGMVTDMMTHAGKDLSTGDYEIFVTKDGYKNSKIAYVTVPGLTQDQSRCSPSTVNVNFELGAIDPVPAKVLIVPQPLNIGRPSSYFVAFVTLPSGYKAADVKAETVTCEGIPALKLIRDSKLFPHTFVAVFSRQDLGEITQKNTVKTVPMTVQGAIRKSGGDPLFTGISQVKVTNKKTTTKEDIDTVMKMTFFQLFTFFK